MYCAPTEPGRNRTRDITARKQVSNRCATSARSRLEFSTLSINDIARIILHRLVYYFHTADMVDTGIHDLPLDDQLTVDFIHPMSWLHKYFVSSRGFVPEFSIGNSSSLSKVESRKLTEALDSCFVLFGILQQCAPKEPGENHTAEEFQTELNSCPVLQPIFGFQLYWLIMNF